MYYLTFDQDWAPDWATLDLVEVLREHDLAGTLFVTHQSDVLQEIRGIGHIELGVHPNFLPGSSHGTTWEAVMEHVLGIVPEAVGVRAHCLIRGTPLLQLYQRLGLQYDASDIFDGLEALRPFQSWTGVWRLPIWWEDDVALQRGQKPVIQEDLAPDNMCTVNIHPVLYALNAADLTCYENLKAYLRDTGRSLQQATREDFARFRQLNGVADGLKRLCLFLQEQPQLCGGTLSAAVRRTLVPNG